jgi:flagellar assembly protein FliH
MKWLESIPLTQPLHDVRVLTHSPSQDWNEHLREREQAAYERGRREGEDSLREELIRQRNEIGGQLKDIIESLHKAVPRLIEDTESALIQLALESAQKMVAGLPINSKLIDAVVREALRQVEDTAGVTVQLHADDLAVLQKHKSAILKDAPGSGAVQFAASAEVTRGGCLVQTRFGVIDARRETKLDQLRKAVAP